MAAKTATLLLVLTLSFIGYSLSAKLLLLPAPIESHIMYFDIVGGGLASNGHQVYMLVPEEVRDNVKVNSNIKIILYQMHGKRELKETRKVLFEAHLTGDNLNAIRLFSSKMVSTCHKFLGNQQLFIALGELQFDHVIVDGFLMSRCFFVVPFKLGVPHSVLTTSADNWNMRIPTLPSVVPIQLMKYSAEMTFWQRLTNTWITTALTIFPQLPSSDDSFVSKYAPERKYKTINQIFGSSQLFLVNYDDMLEFIRPVTPNVIPIGGLTTKPAKPLPAHVDTILQHSRFGVIVVSFGSLVKDLPQSINQKLANAFSQIKETVIWKYDGPKLENITSNIKLLKWLPQNDLLGNPKTKLFVTHCGNNGQFEALYHGVPMLGLPLFGDQPSNAVRMQYKGYGIAMNPLNFDENDLADNMKKILADDRYYKKIKKASEIYRDRPETALQRAVFWIEHVLKYGADHLHSEAFNLNLVQFFMLDILFFFLMLLAVFLFLLKILLCQVIRKILKCELKTTKAKKQ